MNFFGLMNFQAPYLPWVLLAFSLLLGNPVVVDLMGMYNVYLQIKFVYSPEKLFSKSFGRLRDSLKRHFYENTISLWCNIVVLD